jgi:hypothetical protein
VIPQCSHQDRHPQRLRHTRFRLASVLLLLTVLISGVMLASAPQTWAQRADASRPAGSIDMPLAGAALSGAWRREADSTLQYTTETTNPASSGAATVRFRVPTPGAYRLVARVHAPTTSANSLFVALDQPLSAARIWHIPPTGSAVATRVLAWISPTAGVPEPTWTRRPTLTNPRIVTLSNANPSYSGTGQEDVIIRVAERMTRPVSIRRVRNLVLIGGEFTITKPLVATLPNGSKPAIAQHRALAISDVSGDAYLEGIWINNSGGGLSEGLQTWNIGGTVSLRNSRIEGVRTKPNDPGFRFNHPDLIQPMGGSLVLENVTLVDSDYQGLFLAQEPGQSVPAARFRNVNTRAIARQAWFFNTNLPDRAVQACENCWHDLQGSTRPHDPAYSFYPHPVIQAGRAVWLQARAIVPGVSVRLGSPPGGDFAPAERVGLRYQPEAWADTATPDAFTPDAVLVLGAGAHTLHLGGRERDVRISALWLEPTTPRTVPHWSAAATSARLNPPFVNQDGRVGQRVQTTDPRSGGRLQIDVPIATAGFYAVRLEVLAPHDGANSLFVAFDAPPTATDLWDIPPAPGVQRRLVGAPRNGAEPTPDAPVRLFWLTPGVQTLHITGREANVWIAQLAVEQVLP